MKTTMEQPVTPLTYATEIVAMSWRHGGELAVTLGGVVAICLTALATRSLLQLEAFGGTGHVLLVLMAPIAAAILFLTIIAVWRLHRRLTTALATTRSLLDSSILERADLEHQILNRYRRREQRIYQRNEARVDRLDGEIAALLSRPAAS
jgi:hypothetical protein